MPSRIVSAVLKIPSVHTVDITDDAVEVSNSQGEPVDDFEHGLVKHYSTQTIYSRNLITLHDVRRKVSYFCTIFITSAHSLLFRG